MHFTVDIGEDKKSKPETVTFYNSTKFGVNLVDQMAIKYTVNATFRRWFVQFFLQHFRLGCDQCSHFIEVGN